MPCYLAIKNLTNTSSSDFFHIPAVFIKVRKRNAIHHVEIATTLFLMPDGHRMQWIQNAGDPECSGSRMQ